MQTRDDELLSEVLKLSREQRARFAHELLLSLEDEPFEDPATVEAAWAEVLERRAREVLNGTSKSVDARQAVENVRAQLQADRGR